MFGGMMTVKRLKLKKWKKFKDYLKDPTPIRHEESKKAKNNSNRVNAQAKRQYWSSFCNNEINDYKDMQKSLGKKK